jgi:hypothetical protein
MVLKFSGCLQQPFSFCFICYSKGKLHNFPTLETKNSLTVAWNFNENTIPVDSFPILPFSK